MTLIAEEGTSKNTSINQSIPTTDNKFMTPGTYTVIYGVQDSNGNVGSGSQLIKVTGLPTLVANSQNYSILDLDIATQVNQAGTGSWLQAQETAGATPVAVALTPTISITSGPSTDSSKPGLYKVTYSVDNGQGKTATKAVDVFIKDDGAITDPTNTLTINGKDFTLENSEAATLTEAINKDSSHGNVSGIKKVDDGQGNISYVDISSGVTVNQEQLAAIQSADKTGGFYPLTYEEAKNLTADVAKDSNHGNAKALETATGLPVDDISVDAAHLEAIKNTTKAGGIYDLNFNAKKDIGGQEQTATKTTKVTVEGSSVITENGITLSAQNFSLENSEAQSITDTIAKENGGLFPVDIKAVVNNNGTLTTFAVNEISQRIEVNVKAVGSNDPDKKGTINGNSGLPKTGQLPITLLALGLLGCGLLIVGKRYFHKSNK